MDAQTIKSVENRIGQFICLTVPGMLILDSVFKKGLLNNAPSSWVEFVLLLLYSIGLSSPLFVFMCAAALPISWSLEGSNKEEEEQFQSSLYLLLLPFHLLAALCVIWFFRLFTSGRWFEAVAPIGVHPRGIRLTIAYLISILLVFLIVNCSARVVNKFTKPE